MTSSVFSVSSSESMVRTFARQALLPLLPDVLWQIERGTVRTCTWSPDGLPVTLGYWTEGDVVGCSLSRVNPYEIECLTSVEARYIPSGRWNLVLEGIMGHVQQTEEWLAIAHTPRINQRLLQILVWLARKFGREVKGGQLIDLRLTHQAIAESIGTTRVTVTRLLNEFEREGTISRHRRQYIILHSV